MEGGKWEGRKEGGGEQGGSQDVAVRHGDEHKIGVKCLTFGDGAKEKIKIKGEFAP